MDKKGFFFYMSWLEGLQKATRQQQMEICFALIRYAAYGEEPDSEDFAVQLAFQYAKPLIDVNSKKAEGGRRGGRPPKTLGYEKTKPMVSTKNREKEKVTQKEKEERILFNEKEIYREKDGQTTLYSPKESEKRFQKPTVEEVHEYAQTLGYLDFDAQHFWDFYECKGWVVGRAPMKDWKRAVVNWQRNEIQRRKEREQRQKQRPTGNSMADRAYRMVHFELENNPEGWIEEERKWEEFKKQHGL